MRSILTFWDAVVELSALIAIIVTALGVMIGAIDCDRIWGRLGTVLAALVLLLMLPSILLGIWHSLPRLDQLGILVLFGILGIIALHGATRRRKNKSNRPHD